MKTLAEISGTLEKFSAKYSLPIIGAQQGSAAWFTVKLGVLSASNASKIVASTTSETRNTYMAELVAQVATGIMEEINSKYLDWGNQHEDAARSSYEFMTGYTLTQMPFVFMDDTYRIGCSPDSLIFEHNKGNEIKCPFNTVHYIKFLTDGKLKPEYVWQNQFQMFVTGAKEWDAVQYDPRMKSIPIHVETIERDEKAQKTLNDAVPQFIADMDVMLKKAGVSFGEQWSRLAGAQ
jgi:putative phage-type endonuclease